MGKRIGFILLGVAVLIGMKFWNKGRAHDDVKARLVELCEGDAACQRAVDQHFDACFESTYKMGGRRSSAKLDAGKLVQCVNQRGGKAYFSYDAGKE